jgi:hypothetical protein
MIDSDACSKDQNDNKNADGKDCAHAISNGSEDSIGN